MKKIIALLIVAIFIISGASVTAISSHELKWDTDNKNIQLSMVDELDQYQPDMDFFAPVGNIFLAPEINYITAQSFIPTKNVLTRVEILAGKNSTATYDYTLAIKDDLLGPDLTALSLPPEDFVTENFSWVEFDFDDITVTPGITYYIVSSTTDAPDNWYAWGAKLSDVYPDGSVWWSEDEGASWEEDPDADLTFATYGRDNLPPQDPLLDGPYSGKPGIEYDYTVITVDPDGDDLYYIIDWGDGTPETTIGPYPNGDTGTASHSWTSQGTYTVKAKARDVFGAESDWDEITVTIPRNRAINNLLFNFLQKHPYMLQILKLIMGL